MSQPLAMGISHSFIILLSVFHIITSCTAGVIEELILQFRGLITFWIPGSQKKHYVSQGTSCSERKISHGRSHRIWLSGSLSRSLPGSVWVCSPAMHLQFQVGLSVSDTLSLILFDLLASISIRLHYTVLSCILISYLLILRFPP